MKYAHALRWAATALVLLATFDTGISLGRTDIATMPVSDVRPGMKGYGLSVFRGTQPERFDVEVIDVLHKFRPDQDLILIRTPHPRLNQTQAVAGMSGSPIYLEGKLAGAYAYGWPFGTEPIVGVTPIADMLAELARPIDPEIWRMLGPEPRRIPKNRRLASNDKLGADKLADRQRHRAALRRGPLPAFKLGDRRNASWALSTLAQSRVLNRGGHRPEAAVTPLMLGGMSDAATALLEKELAPFGFHPLQTGGAAAHPSAAGKGAGYVNGSAVGVQLIRGDISATGVGTVTHVQGNRLVAFGHPMMNMGQSAMPTTTAEVVHILASQQKSFKMSRPVRAMGTMVQDRQAAIVVDTNLEPHTVPVRLTVRFGSGPEAAQARTWNFEVASHRALTPMLILSAIINGLQATVADEVDAIFDAKTHLEISGQPSLDFTDHGHMPYGPASSMSLSQLRIFSAIDAAYGNPFQRAHIEQLSIDLTVKFSDNVVGIENVRVPYAEVDPGSTVPVHVTLRSFNGPRRVKTVMVTIPQSAAGKKLSIEVASGGSVQPTLPRARNLPDLLRGLQVNYPTDSLVVSTVLPSQGLRMRGYVLSDLPESVFSTLKTASESTSNPLFKNHHRQVVPLGQVVYGNAKVQLDVREEATND